MASLPGKRPVTYEDLLKLPEGVIGEILNGELHTQPRPAGPHALTSSVLGAEILGPFQLGRGGPGGWWILDEPELHLGSNVLVPDLAGWRRERMPAIPESNAFTIAPDWVCEVLSPSTARKDRMIKLPLYAAHGVAWFWMVNPDAKIVEIFKLHGGHWLLEGVFGEDAKVKLPPFEAVEIDLAHFWVP